MAAWWVCGFLPLLLLAVAADGDSEPLIRLPTENGHAPAPAPGPAASAPEEGVTKWAVLVAGSSGYENYRHQVRVLSSSLMQLVYHSLYETFDSVCLLNDCLRCC